MMRMTLRSNIPRVAGRYAKLPKRFEAATVEISEEWAKEVKKGAKLRVPRGRGGFKNTGTLRNSINMRQKGNKTWAVGVYGKAWRYGRYVERGFRPHWIPIEYIEQHKANPGQKGQYVGDRSGNESWGGFGWTKPKAWVYLKGTAHPFLRPAMTASIKKLPKIIKRGWDKHLKLKKGR